MWKSRLSEAYQWCVEARERLNSRSILGDELVIWSQVVSIWDNKNLIIVEERIRGVVIADGIGTTLGKGRETIVTGKSSSVPTKQEIGSVVVTSATGIVAVSSVAEIKSCVDVTETSGFVLDGSVETNESPRENTVVSIMQVEVFGKLKTIKIV